MDKEELIGIYRTAINNCMLVYAAMVLFAHEDMPMIYQKWSSSLEIPRPHDEEELLALLLDRNVSKHAFSELYDTVHRSALKELFEVTKKYCIDTNQEKMLYEQSWYQFWRVLRNCLSHDFKFQFKEYDKNKLPVSWSGITIDETMEGIPLMHKHLSREKLLEFISEVRKFIETKLA